MATCLIAAGQDGSIPVSEMWQSCLPQQFPDSLSPCLTLKLFGLAVQDVAVKEMLKNTTGEVGVSHQVSRLPGSNLTDFDF